MMNDLRYGFRRLLGSPGFTVVVVLSLTLGIGANTAVFSLMNAVMLKTLPVKHPEQLVLLNFSSGRWLPPGTNQTGSANTLFSYPSFEHFRTQNQVFSSIFGFVPLDPGKENVSVYVDGQASLAAGEMVSGSYFSGLGVSPIVGRAIAEEDEKPNAPCVAVISYGYWAGKFGRDASVVGKAIALNGLPFTVVGVTPPEFFGVTPGRAVDIWLPLVKQPELPPWGLTPPRGASLLTSRNWWWMMVMGRLKPGVTEQQARIALDVLFQQSITVGVNPPPKPDELPRLKLTRASRGLDNLRRQFSEPLWILMTTVGLVLLIASANAATLLLARATARRKEISVRLALGASRARLIRQLLTESLLLAGMGGVLGLLFASWGIHALLLLISSRWQPIILDVRPDLHVLAFTAAVSMLTGILFGLMPAFHATRMEVAPALKETAGSVFAGRHGPRLGLGKPLVIAQVALSLVLLVGAGLFVRTLHNLENQNFGFNRHNLLLFGVDPTNKDYGNPRLVNLYGRLLERIQSLPGVRSATLSWLSLISGLRLAVSISIEGYAPKRGEEEALVWWNAVGPQFFETMGIRVLLGRGIEWRDTETSPQAAVVNESLARRFFDDGNPIGRRLSFGEARKANDEFEIVGVVENGKYTDLREGSWPTVYLPYTQVSVVSGGLGSMHFEVRSAGDPLTLVPAVRRVVHEIEPDLPLFDVKSQTQQIDESLMQERLFARLSSFFGLLALLLACIGLHGTMAYAVTRRTQEIGVRMALGAQKADVLRMVMRETLLPVLIGVAIGLPCALAASKFISSMLFGVKPTDLLTISLAMLVMMTVAVFAGYLPARRASRVDPMVALRYE